MLLITSVITGYLVWRTWATRSAACALGYVIVGPLLTVPLFIVGNSISGAIFATDVLLAVYFLRFLSRRKINVVNLCCRLRGIAPAFFIFVLAIVSAALNWSLVEPNAWKFYSFCTTKYGEFAVIAIIVATARIDSDTLAKISKPIAVAYGIYGTLLLLHLLHILDFRGQQYFTTDPTRVIQAGEDAQSWFMTAFKAQIGANASIGFFLLVALMRWTRHKWALWAISGVLLVDVLLTTSRSDIAGLAVGLAVMCAAVLVFETHRTRYLTAIAAVVLVVIIAFGYVWQSWDKQSRERIAEFWDADARKSGTYRDRSHDQQALTNYMLKFPIESVIGAGPGNYARYAGMGVTVILLGHNAYLSILGELGFLGLLALLWWCCVMGWAFSCVIRRRAATLIGAAGLALVADRMIASWGADSLFAPFNMGNCNLLAIAAIYLIWRASHVAEGRVGVQARQEVTVVA